MKISKDGPSISYLFFADDCLLFIKAKATQVHLVVSVLNDFCGISRLKVNVAKTKVITSRCVSRVKCDKFASICQFHFTSNVGRHLGFPMLSGRVKNEDFLYLIERLQSKLAGWKSSLLNKAGRFTLAKVVLSAIPIYLMQIF